MGHSVCVLQTVSSVFLFFFVQKWCYIYFFCNLCVCFIICPSESCESCFFFIHFISVAVILLVSFALMVQFSLPCNIAGRDNILYYCFH